MINTSETRDGTYYNIHCSPVGKIPTLTTNLNILSTYSIYVAMIITHVTILLEY